MGKECMTQPTTATPIREPLLQQDLVFLGEQESNDLSYWELVHHSDADSDYDSLLRLEDGFLSWFSVTTSSPPDTNQEIQTHKKTHEDPDLIDRENPRDDHDRWYHGDVHNYRQFDVGPAIFSGVGKQHQDANGYGEEVAEEEEEEDEYGLDDELVAREWEAREAENEEVGEEVFC